MSVDLTQSVSGCHLACWARIYQIFQTRPVDPELSRCGAWRYTNVAPCLTCRGKFETGWSRAVQQPLLLTTTGENSVSVRHLVGQSEVLKSD